MRGISFALITLFSPPVFSQEVPTTPPPPPSEPTVGSMELNTRPAKLEASDLKEFDGLAEPRRKMIEAALTVLRDSPWLPYTAAGAEPDSGGFDCSGAIHFILSKVGLEPPRSSAAQYEWLKTNNRLNVIAPAAVDTTDPSLAKLRPGDLVFWSAAAATEEAPDAVRIHHVAMYLGTEKKDGRAVMINATDGRTYRGQKGNGFGIYDFVIPKAGSRSKMAGYGTPPGLAE